MYDNIINEIIEDIKLEIRNQFTQYNFYTDNNIEDYKKLNKEILTDDIYNLLECYIEDNDIKDFRILKIELDINIINVILVIFLLDNSNNIIEKEITIIEKVKNIIFT